MGNYCTKSEPDDEVVKPKFVIGKDYQELEGEFSGEGVKKTVAWKATISRPLLEAKREEFWQTRTTGRRNVWLVIKNAMEADPQTATLLLQMSGIIIKGENLTVLEDTNGNVYEIPPFMINDPVSFANEKKKTVVKKEIKENIDISLKIRRPGVAEDVVFEVNNLITGADLKKIYSEKVSIPLENLRLFFGGREIGNEKTLVSHLIQNDMVIQAFVKINENA